MSDELLGRVVDALREREAVEGWRVDRVTVGDAAVLVELVDTGTTGDDGGRRTAGLAHRPPGDRPSGPLHPRAAADLVDPFASTHSSAAGDASLLDRAVGIATLNALSAPYVDWETGDPMADLDPAVSTIATVGLFRPAFRKFADVTVRVIEREPVDAAAVSTPEDVTVESFTPAEATAAMDGAEVVFVTGSTLVYGGIERYLDAAPDEATVVLIGATASMLPEPLFAAGVDVVAGAVVEDVDRARTAVAAGACGTDLHDRGVRKGFVSRSRTTELSPHGDANDCT